MGLDFYVALSGLRAGETMLQVAQNNIANAKNTSYARQRADVSTLGIPGGNSGIKAQMGSGVWIDQISRIKDDLLIQQVRTEVGKVGYNSGLRSVLSNVEMVFNETGESSISDLTQNFFNAFQEANKFPEQSSYRLELVYSSVLFSEKIQGISVQLDEIKSQADSQIQVQTQAINGILDKITNINKKMESISSDKVNALLDERDKHLDELAQFIDIKVENKSHPINMEISVGNTKILSGKEYYPIESKHIGETDKWVLSIGDIKLDLEGGSLKGVLESRNVLIKEYEKGLNDYVGTFIKEVNAIHKNGFGLDSTTGEDFFVGTDIRTIKINDVLKDNPEKIGLSDTAGISGNTGIGEKLADLKNMQVIEGKTLPSFYQEYIVRMASELNVARDNEMIHQGVASAMEREKQNVQGVNIDEELTNMMVVQQYYQANAKTLKMVEKMLDEVLNLV